jgi:hypothetical protein
VWLAKDWMFLCDTVLVYLCLLMYQQLGKHSAVAFLHPSHPAYSTHLTLYVSYLFPCMKEWLNCG